MTDNASRTRSTSEPSSEPTPEKVSFIRPIRGAVIASLAATWAQALATTALVLLVGVTFDAVRDRGGVTSGLVAVIAAVVVARAAIAGIIPLISIEAAGRLEDWGRSTIYGHLLRLGAPLRSRARTGKLVSTAAEAVEQASFYYATFLGPVIASMSVPLLVVAVVAIFLDGWAALWLFVAIPVVPLMVGGFQTRFQAVSDGYRDTANSLSARFLDALQGLPTLKLFNRGQAHGATLREAAEELRQAIMRLLAGNQVVLFVVDALFSLGMVTLAAALAMIRLRAGAITPGEAVALVLLGLQLIEPLDKVGQFFYVGMSGQASAKEIRKVLAHEPVVAEPEAAEGPGRIEPSVRFEQVGFSYGETEVLREVTFTIGPGQTAALVGPSGAGKTTVANLLQRAIAPDRGTISIGGVDVGAVPSGWVRDQISVVAQSTYLFTGTLRYNLQVAHPEATDEELWAALSDANLDEFVRSLPDRLDTPVGERGMSLSGGQAQRLAIARALLKDAPIVVLDEPTASVDLESEAAILSALDRLMVDRTVLVIAHRLSTVRDADEIIVVEDGQITERGTHDELMHTGGHYARAVQHSTTEVGA